MFGRLSSRRGTARSRNIGAGNSELDGGVAAAVDRRNVLRLGGMAAAGAAGVAVATALNASPADATTGNMQYGGFNDAGSAQTSLISTNDPTLYIGDTSGSDTNHALGVRINGSGTAIQVFSAGAGVDVTAVGNGVTAHSSGGGNGVYALNGTTTGIAGPAAVYGDSDSATGVFGTTTTGIAARGLHGGYSGLESLGGFVSGFTCGVIGEDNASGVGVIGASPSGIGVDGLSSAGTAVKGITASGTAISAQTTGGTTLNPTLLAQTAAKGPAIKALATLGTNASPALVAQSAGAGPAVQATTTLGTNPSPAVKATSASAAPAVQAIGKAVVASTGVGAGNAAALSVQGVASFTRSNVAQVPINASGVLTALVPGGLGATSRVLATIQSQFSQNIAIKSAVPILSGANQGKIQINLTAANTSGAVINVAWFVFG